jgi:hypothetical protein
LAAVARCSDRNERDTGVSARATEQRASTRGREWRGDCVVIVGGNPNKHRREGKAAAAVAAAAARGWRRLPAAPCHPVPPRVPIRSAWPVGYRSARFNRR